jgi:CheY-like chemotaxis protein
MSPANILLVDDNDDVREVTALLLRDSGYHVIAASSGSAALEVLGGDSAIDLLIVDFAMPGMSGVELLERARTKRPEIKAVFITGYVDHAKLGAKFANEVVVRKPFTMDQLALAARKVLGLAEG